METEVLIIGGGIAGLSLAALLGEAGLSCAILDPQKLAPAANDVPSGRTAALMHGSINILKSAGVWESLDDLSCPLRTLRIVDDGNPNIKKISIDFQAHEIGLDAFGYNIPNNLLRNALINRVSKLESVKMISPARLMDYRTESGKVIAKLDCDAEITAHVIVGADGRKSMTRQIAGIEVSERPYGQNAITCLIDHSKPHNNTSTEHHRPGGPFTLVPMPGNQSSVVWVEKTEDAEKFIKLDKNSFEKTVQERTRGALGEIKLASSPESWPLCMVAAKELIAPRMALAAEAAHVMSPIGAQGLNLSLRDIAALAETLIDAARVGEDIGSQSVLQRYERRRRADVKTRVAGVDGFNRIVSNNLGYLRGLRRAGLKSLEAIPAIKTIVMQQGLTPTLDEGRLLKGQAL